MRPTAYRCGGFRFVGSVIGDTRESGHASEKIGAATLRSPLWKLRATVWKTAASALTSLREMALQQLTRHAGTAKRSASHIRPHEWWAGLWVGKSCRWPRARGTGNLFRAVIVLLANRFQPDYCSFLSEMSRPDGKTTVWGCAVPMLDSRSAFNYISLANDARGLLPFLIVASTFSDQQNLTARMTMPIQLCTSLIGFSSCTPQVDLLYTEPYGSV
jgi:hypothetical protein